tara:strand:+ start:1823 stop:2974 length:1152 start_codon:yes stop_codon:yes gene_type:complete
MSATTQTKNMTLINDMFTAFMERAVDEGGPLAEWDEQVATDFMAFWFHDDNQKAFSKVLGSMKTTVRKSKKSDDDTPKPRRPKSAYLFFCKENREEVVEKMTEENDGTKPAPKDVLSGLGAAWKELKESTKVKDKKLMAKYEEMAKIDKDECHKENGTSPDEKKKNDGKPKRAKSAYLFFCQAHRDEVKQELEDENGEKPTPKDVTTELGRKWNELKGSKKKADKDKLAAFDKMKEADKARYESEMSAYSSDNTGSDSEDVDTAVDAVIGDIVGETKPADDEADEKYEQALTDLAKVVNKTTTKRKLPESLVKATEKKPANKRPTVKVTGYSLYAKEMREEVKEENPDCKAAEITKILSGMWKELDEEEQEEFKERAKTINEC